MKQTVLTLSTMCMFTALCAQLLSGSTYMRTVRMAFGLQVFLTMLTLICEIFPMQN